VLQQLGRLAETNDAGNRGLHDLQYGEVEKDTFNVVESFPDDFEPVPAVRVQAQCVLLFGSILRLAVSIDSMSRCLASRTADKFAEDVALTLGGVGLFRVRH
jgi:hypothetical protein